MTDSFHPAYLAAQSATCVLCHGARCRVGVDRNDQFAPDVLCHGCFESAPTSFKLTSAQHVFRELVRDGCHPKMAIRACSIATRSEPLRDISADVAWFNGLLKETT